MPCGMFRHRSCCSLKDVTSYESRTVLDGILEHSGCKLVIRIHTALAELVVSLDLVMSFDPVLMRGGVSHIGEVEKQLYGEPP